MFYKIQEIDGIEPVLGIRLREVGIVTTADLLARCGAASGRRSVAHASGLPENQLLVWVSKADLMRVPGIGQDYADVLLAAGIASVDALRQCEPLDLIERIKEANRARRITRSTPSHNKVAKWIEEAGRLEAVVSA